MVFNYFERACFTVMFCLVITILGATDTDTLTFESWPDCPKVEQIRMEKFDKELFLLSWNGFADSRVEYELIVKDRDANVLHTGFYNETTAVLKISDLKKYFIEIRSHCYIENATQSLVGEWSLDSFVQEEMSIVSLCQIGRQVATSIVSGNSKIPDGFHVSFNYYYKGSVKGNEQYYSTLNPEPIVDGKLEELNITNITVYTEGGIVTCRESISKTNFFSCGGGSFNNNDYVIPVSTIPLTTDGPPVTNVTIDLSQYFACSNSPITISYTSNTNSGNFTTYSNDGNFSFNAFGCGPINVIVFCESSGNQQCEFDFDVPCDGIPDTDDTDPFAPSCESIQLNSFSLPGSNECYIHYSGTEDMSASLSYDVGGVTIEVASDNSSGIFSIPSNVTATLTTILNYVDSNGNTQSVECNYDISGSCSEIDPTLLNNENCDLISIDALDNCGFSISGSNSSTLLITALDANGVILTATVSGFGDVAEFSNITEFDVLIFDNESGTYSSCSFDELECGVDPDAEIILCPDDIVLELLEGPTGCFVNWVIPNGSGVEFHIDGEYASSSTNQSGSYEIGIGQTLDVVVLDNGGDEMCSHQFTCAELSPDLQFNSAFMCDFFELLEGHYQSDNSLRINIANGNPYLINQFLSDNGYTSDDLEEFLSQINTINITLNYPTTPTQFTIYENPTGAYGGGTSNFFDPLNWTYTISPFEYNGDVVDYQLEIIDVDNRYFDCGSSSFTIQHPVEDYEEEVDGLPYLECNDDPNTEITSDELYTADLEGVTITYNGFPLLVLSATAPNSSGVYSGTAILAVPFQSLQVEVAFEDFTINREYQVMEGELILKSENPAPYIDMYFPPLSIGGDICIPTPPPGDADGDGFDDVTGLDVWGFNMEGTYKDTDNPYDDNFFDANGNFVGEGAENPPVPFNPDGCNREGEDIDGGECNPSGEDEVLTEFIETIQPTLGTKLCEISQDLSLTIDADITTNNTSFDLLRSEMETLVNDELGWADTKEFVFGENNEYISPGMSNEFTTAPKVPEVEYYMRDENVENLEIKHVELYELDLKNFQLLDAKAELHSICEESNLQQLVDHIIALINSWGAVQREKYLDDEEAFDNWLLEEFEKYLLDNDEGTGFIEESPIKFFKKPTNIPDMSYSPYSSIASAGDYLGERVDDEVAMWDAFNRGDKVIGGVHRAYFLKAMSEAVSGGETNLTLMPINVSKQIGSYIYTIYIDNLRFNLNSSPLLDAYFILEDPSDGGQAVFEALNVPFGPGGITEEGKLTMYGSDVEIRLNNSALLIVQPGPQTFITWNCQGLSEFSIKGQVEFCRDFIIPLTEDLKPKEDGERFRLDFYATFTEWLEVVTQATATSPFAMAKYEKYAWSFQNVTIDLDRNSGVSIKPPEGYQSVNLSSDNTLGPAWKGFYIDEFSLNIPNDFESSSGDIAINANDVIIDRTGVTGEASIQTEIVSIDEGNLDGWAFSIDELHVLAIQNHISGGAIGGTVNIPIFDANLDYFASIYPNNRYDFGVTLNAPLTSDFLLGEVVLDQNSWINVEYTEGEGFKNYANLTGTLEMTGTSENGDSKLKIPKVQFTKLGLSNVHPVISSGEFKLLQDEGEGGFKNFPLSIDQIGLFQYEGETDGNAISYAECVLHGGLKLFPGDFNLDVRGGIGVVGKLIDEGGKHKWRFDKVNPKEFCVGGSLKGTSTISGCVSWYENEWYQGKEFGNGFTGALSVEFDELLSGNQITAVGMFGQLPSDKRYFFVDVQMDLGVPIPLGAAPISLTGFGGGLSYHMKSTFDPSNIEVDVVNVNALKFGESLSKTLYHPDLNSCLGLKGSADFELQGGSLGASTLNGTLELGLLFNCQSENDSNSSFSLKEGYFKGIAKVMTPPIPVSLKNLLDGVPEQLTEGLNKNPSVDAALKGYVYMNADFNNKTFTGDMGVFLETPGNVLAGLLPDSKVIDGSFYFGPGNWYLKFGDPVHRCGVGLFIGDNTYDSDPSGPQQPLATLSSYFYAGNSSVPTIPPPPFAISGYTPLQNIGTGKGVIFGADYNLDLNASSGVFGVDIISTHLNAQVGFDMMFMKMNDFTCNNDAVGVYGWYASGQMYAQLTGSVEIFNTPVFEAGISAVLQARFPNPTFMGGALEVYAAGKYRTVTVALGDDCDFVNTNPDTDLGIDLITSFEPAHGGQAISPMEIPTVQLEGQINKLYTIEYPAGAGQDSWKFIESDDAYKMTDSDNNSIAFEVKYLNNKKTVQLVPYHLLPAGKTITCDYSFDVYQNGEFLKTYTRSYSFMTSEIEEIPAQNIKGSFPVVGMQNFHIDNHDDCYIELDRYQSEINATYPLEGPFINLKGPDGEHVLDATLDYKTITFDLLEHVKLSEEYTIQLFMKSLEDEDFKQVLFEYNFSTSEYVSVEEKLINVFSQAAVVEGNSITNNWSGEGFDEIDLDLYAFSGLGTWVVDEYKTVFDFMPIYNSDITIQSEINQLPLAQSMYAYQKELDSYVNISSNDNEHQLSFEGINYFCNDLKNVEAEINDLYYYNLEHHPCGNLIDYVDDGAFGGNENEIELCMNEWKADLEQYKTFLSELACPKVGQISSIELKVSYTLPSNKIIYSGFPINQN